MISTRCNLIFFARVGGCSQISDEGGGYSQNQVRLQKRLWSSTVVVSTHSNFYKSLRVSNEIERYSTFTWDEIPYCVLHSHRPKFLFPTIYSRGETGSVFREIWIFVKPKGITKCFFHCSKVYLLIRVPLLGTEGPQKWGFARGRRAVYEKFRKFENFWKISHQKYNENDFGGFSKIIFWTFSLQSYVFDCKTSFLF